MYERPKCEVIYCDEADIITTSTLVPTEWDGEDEGFDF